MPVSFSICWRGSKRAINDCGGLLNPNVSSVLSNTLLKFTCAEEITSRISRADYISLLFSVTRNITLLWACFLPNFPTIFTRTIAHQISSSAISKIDLQFVQGVPKKVEVNRAHVFSIFTKQLLPIVTHSTSCSGDT